MQAFAKNCRKPQDVQTYMIQFQGFTQDLMMLMGNLMVQVASAVNLQEGPHTMTEKTVADIFNKNDYKDAV